MTFAYLYVGSWLPVPSYSSCWENLNPLSLNLGFLTDLLDPTDCGRNDTTSEETPKLLPGSLENAWNPESPFEYKCPAKGLYQKAPRVHVEGPASWALPFNYLCLGTKHVNPATLDPADQPPNDHSWHPVKQKLPTSQTMANLWPRSPPDIMMFICFRMTCYAGIDHWDMAFIKGTLKFDQPYQNHWRCAQPLTSLSQNLCTGPKD